MSAFWLVNGMAVANNEMVIPPDARFLRYGDGLFESMRMKGHEVIAIQQHLNRFTEACSFLDIEQPHNFSLVDEAAKLWEMAKRPISARLRLQVWRTGGTFYRAEDQGTLRILELHPLAEAVYPGGPAVPMLGLFDGQPVNPAPLGNFKTSSCLPSILAANWAKHHGFDDALLLDHAGNLAEATSSNFFAVLEGQILTPDLKQGGLHGVMRQTVIDLAQALGHKVTVGPISPDLLFNVSELFLTNSVRGVVPVHSYCGKSLHTTVANKLLTALNRQTFS